MFLTRRQLLERGAATAAMGMLPWTRTRSGFPLDPRLARGTTATVDGALTDPAQVRTLALRAVDAARAAGAVYADVRLTRIVSQGMKVGGRGAVEGMEVDDWEHLEVGVRALYNGYWGFAASPYWLLDEMDALARSAVAQAKTNALGTPRQVELGAIPVVTGTWTTPGIDPFSITLEEKTDFMTAWQRALLDWPRGTIVAPTGQAKMQFARQERTFASTDGSVTAQITYETFGDFPVTVQQDDWQAQPVPEGGRGLARRGGGWETMLDAKLTDQIPQMLADAEATLALKRKPVELGRFTLVCDAVTAANMLSTTLGAATELDRALGYEAVSSGTSYLGPDPLALLGTLRVAAPSVTVTANRNLPGGLATVQWDDEGVVPDTFPLVQQGILTDYQTTREQAAWLAPWYAKQGSRGPAGHSHGCAAASSASRITMQHRPNLTLEPGAASLSFDEMVANTEKGIAVLRAGTETDYQAKTGVGQGLLREIKNGKLGAVLTSGGFLFDSSEFWNNVMALGGRGSEVSVGLRTTKGRPDQGMHHTATAVPITVKDVPIINVMRRA